MYREKSLNIHTHATADDSDFSTPLTDTIVHPHTLLYSVYLYKTQKQCDL